MNEPDDTTTPAAAAAVGAANVAFVLALSIGVALNLITIALLVAAWFIEPTPGLSANGTQLLTGWGGGIIGVLGSFIGFTFGQKVSAARADATAAQPRSIKQTGQHAGDHPR